MEKICDRCGARVDSRGMGPHIDSRACIVRAAVREQRAAGRVPVSDACAARIRAARGEGATPSAWSNYDPGFRGRRARVTSSFWALRADAAEFEVAPSTARNRARKEKNDALYKATCEQENFWLGLGLLGVYSAVITALCEAGEIEILIDLPREVVAQYAVRVYRREFVSQHRGWTAKLEHNLVFRSIADVVDLLRLDFRRGFLAREKTCAFTSAHYYLSESDAVLLDRALEARKNVA